MTLTKKEMIKIIHKNLQYDGYDKEQTAKIVESLIEVIKRTLASGENILISNFGKFCVNDKKTRKGRNPATGEEMMLDARRVVTFQYSGSLRKKL